MAEGIKGFDLDKGRGCYLGLAVSSVGKKEVLPQLYPAWEAALEPDVSRAIERVSMKSAPPLTTPTKIGKQGLVGKTEEGDSQFWFNDAGGSATDGANTIHRGFHIGHQSDEQFGPGSSSGTPEGSKGGIEGRAGRRGEKVTRHPVHREREAQRHCRGITG